MRLAALWGDAVSSATSLVWNVAQRVNRTVPDSRFQPAWAPAPLPKQAERSFPQLGFPRETDSLCPQCVIEVRERIVAGRRELARARGRAPGEIKARDRRARRPGLDGEDLPDRTARGRT